MHHRPSIDRFTATTGANYRAKTFVTPPPAPFYYSKALGRVIGPSGIHPEFFASNLTPPTNPLAHCLFLKTRSLRSIYASNGQDLVQRVFGPE